VAVGAELHRAGLGKALEMHLVADAVSRTAEPSAILLRGCLQEAMIVGVAESHLQHVVVDVADRRFDLDPRNSYRLELKPGHRTRCVLGQYLVDLHGDVFAGASLAADKVLFYDLLSQSLTHNAHTPRMKSRLLAQPNDTLPRGVDQDGSVQSVAKEYLRLVLGIIMYYHLL